MRKLMISNEIVTEGIEYILNHIWEGVTLEAVAEHCHMSVSRFSAVFKEQTGESVYAFIKRIKLEQSALKLKIEADRDITEIGEDFGYSASNYSSAFSQYHKMSPTAFRNEIKKRNDIQNLSKQDKEIVEEMNRLIRVEINPDYHVMYERTIGNYSEMNIAWCDFVEKHCKDFAKDTILFDRTFDDPTITQKERCIYDICMTTKHPELYKNTCVLKGGKFAIYPFKGYMNEIFPIHQRLISLCFPANHFEIDERYNYNRYKKVADDGYMEFDICIPIK